jgi:hypothetical protein
MYPASGKLILGFHGCDEAVGLNIISGKDNLRPSENDWDWLGHGMYFWESDPQRALEYATILQKRKSSKTKIKKPFVLGAVIDLGNCLDLLNRTHLDLLHDSYLILARGFEKAGEKFPINTPLKGSEDLLHRNLDCAVVEFLHKSIDDEKNVKPFDSVRAAFWEGADLYPNAGFRELNHIQICVRNSRCIKGYFLPRYSNDFPAPDEMITPSIKH